MRPSSIGPAVVVFAFAAASATAAFARPISVVRPGIVPDHTQMVVISRDTFTNPDSQHRTEVEPDTFSWGNTMVAVFQVGRFVTGGGASDIGWATTIDGGASWHRGNFHGVTRIQDPSAPYDRASDTSIAYDAKHGRWLAEILPILSGTGMEPVVMRSKNGLHWSKPIKVAPDNGDFIDKPWIACDNWKSSPYFGNCYIEADDFALGEQEVMYTSRDGGLTWSAPYDVPNLFGTAGQPLALPNGTAVVPYVNVVDGTLSAFTSRDGGKTWGNSVAVAQINYITQSGSLRSHPFPSAEISGNGRVYVAWPDCSFRAGCASNDIVYSSSADGVTWEKVKRIPIDRKTSTVDHFLPGLAVDPRSTPPNVHLALSYYYYPVANCPSGQCELRAGYISSIDGGKTWSNAVNLWHAMQPSWLAATDQGYMIGDYISTSFLNGMAYPGVELARPPSGGLLDEFTATSVTGLPLMPQLQSYPNMAEEQRYPVGHRRFQRPFLPPFGD